MAEAAFEIIVSVMRYLFLAIMLYLIISLVFRSLVEYRRIRFARHYTEENQIHTLRFLAPDSLAGELVELEAHNTIGSDEACDICVENSSLLPKHATLFERNGVYYLKTKVREHAEINGNPFPRGEVPLRADDTIWIREICFTCRRERIEDVEIEAALKGDA